MTAGLPELTTFGAIIRFAASLEEKAAACYEGWASDDLAPLALAHRKRASQLTRMVQEQLNEMTLEPITGLSAQDYLSAAHPKTDVASADRMAVAVEVESALGRLYDDLVARAGQVLGAASRSLERLSRQSREAVESLQRNQRGFGSP